MSSRAITRSFFSNQFSPAAPLGAPRWCTRQKGSWKRVFEFVLPLFGQAAGTHDQTALEVSPGDQIPS